MKSLTSGDPLPHSSYSFIGSLNICSSVTFASFTGLPLPRHCSHKHFFIHLSTRFPPALLVHAPFLLILILPVPRTTHLRVRVYIRFHICTYHYTIFTRVCLPPYISRYQFRLVISNTYKYIPTVLPCISTFFLDHELIPFNFQLQLQCVPVITLEFSRDKRLIIPHTRAVYLPHARTHART